MMSLITAGLEGVGAAALAKRFVGAPLGQWTGTGAGAGAALITKKGTMGMVAGAVGGYIHDNVGNVGGATSSGNIVLY